MGANKMQTIRAFTEAESYNGPSLIIAYSHCIAHGINMTKGLFQQKLAVDSGYWPLYRFNPVLANEGTNPLQLDSKEIEAEGTLKIGVDVTNTGTIAGEEVVQLYVGYVDSRVERPLKELKSFLKIHLTPGETKRVELILEAKHLAYFDEQSANWIVEPITYTVHVGPSSCREDLLSAQFRVCR